MDTASEPAVNILELRDHLAEYLRRAQAGETIVVTSDGQPIARLAPVEPKVKKIPRAALYGAYKGRGWISPDFDDDDPDTIAAAEAGQDS